MERCAMHWKPSSYHCLCIKKAQHLLNTEKRTSQGVNITFIYCRKKDTPYYSRTAPDQQQQRCHRLLSEHHSYRPEASFWNLQRGVLPHGSRVASEILHKFSIECEHCDAACIRVAKFRVEWYSSHLHFYVISRQYFSIVVRMIRYIRSFATDQMH